MSPILDLHHDPRHRARQLRWAGSAGALLFAAAALTLAVLYFFAARDVGAEFFHAHKTISNTGALLRRGVALGAAALVIAIAATLWWIVRQNHRIVRPVHALHAALVRLASGDLGVRLELSGDDEFQEVGAALSTLVAEFASVLERAHALADRVEALAADAATGRAGAAGASELHAAAAELNRAVDFFRLDPARRGAAGV